MIFVGAKRVGTKKKALALAGASTAAARRAEELLALITRRKARIAEDFYEIGTALREIKKKKLYAALGFRSFADLLAKRDVISARSADKLIEIVEAMPRAPALAVGSERAYALARLAAVTPELDSAELILAEGVKVKGRARKVDKLSTRQLEETIRAVRPRRADPEAAAAKRTAVDVRRRLRDRGAAKATAEPARGAGGWWIVVRLPVDEVPILVGRPRAPK